MTEHHSVILHEQASGFLPRPLGFSKAVKGQLQNLTQRLGDFTVTGGEQDGQKANKLSLIQQLPTNDLLQDLSDEEYGVFNKLLPEVTQVLIGQKDGYLDGLGGEDTQGLLQAAIFLTKQTVQHKENPGEHVVLRTVYGATEAMPLRGLSYLLPALTRMQGLFKKGVALPQYQVIFANHIGAKLNGMSEVVVCEQTHIFAEVAREYIETFFPEIAKNVIFLEDTPLERGTVLERDLGRVAEESKVIFAEKTDLNERLQAKGTNHGSALTASYYATAHLLMHDTDASAYTFPLFSDQQSAMAPRVIISIGGKQERDFYISRFAIKHNIQSQQFSLQTGQLFTRHHVPPYYMANGGDRLLRGKPTSCTRAAQEDLNYLTNVTLQRAEAQKIDTDLEYFLIEKGIQQ